MGLATAPPGIGDIFGEKPPQNIHSRARPCIPYPSSSFSAQSDRRRLVGDRYRTAGNPLDGTRRRPTAAEKDLSL
jgi:hypothetical protein